MNCPECQEEITSKRAKRFCGPTCRNRALSRRNVIRIAVSFWDRVEKQENGCWLWLNRTTRRYGKFRGQPVHRYAYELFKGSVPPGLELDHLCRNPYCVNPDHLEAVTHKENVLRGEANAAINARMTHCKNGHPLPTDRDRQGKRRCQICAADLARKRIRRKAA